MRAVRNRGSQGTGAGTGPGIAAGGVTAREGGGMIYIIW